MKKLLIGLISTGIFFSSMFSITALADTQFNASLEDHFEEAIDTSLNKEYLLDMITQEKIYSAYKTNEDGKLVEITLDEYNNILTNMEQSIEEENVQQAIEPRSPTIWKTYRYSGQKGNSVVNGARVKVSPDVKGPASLSSGYSTTVSNSFGGTFSASVGDLIKKSASFTWNISASTTKTFSVTYKVPKGKTGYVGFTPYLNKTWGIGYEDTRTQTGVISTKSATVYGYSPKKLKSGLADGLYALVYK